MTSDYMLKPSVSSIAYVAIPERGGCNGGDYEGARIN
jgi:hypothetical protein